MFLDVHHQVHVSDLVWALHIACYKLQLLTFLAAYHASHAMSAVMQNGVMEAEVMCNRVDNTHPDTLAQTFYIMPDSRSVA